MRSFIVAIAAIAAWQGSALACSCIPLEGADQRREAAQRIARDAAAVAEIELIEPMDQEAMRPELYRVLTVHVGTAAATFRLARDFERSPDGQVYLMMTSCDVAPARGERALVVLHPRTGDSARSRSSCPDPTKDKPASSEDSFKIGGTCTHMFVNSPGALDLIREEARKLGMRVR